MWGTKLRCIEELTNSELADTLERILVKTRDKNFFFLCHELKDEYISTNPADITSLLKVNGLEDTISEHYYTRIDRKVVWSNSDDRRDAIGKLILKLRSND